MTSKFEYRLKACLISLEDCHHCLDKSLIEEDLSLMKDCVRFVRECANICMYTIDALTRQSSFDQNIVSLCAEICERCADACEKHAHEHCQQCSHACRACAKACREFANIV